MKPSSLLVAIFSAAILAARVEAGPITIKVEQNSKTDMKVEKGKPAGDKTQVRSLKIQLDNNSNEALDALSVKYWFIGRAMLGHDNKVLVEGERKSTLPPRGREVVESEEVSKKFVEAHTEMKGKTMTKVPASGDKILGYAVRVLKDGKVLAEYYSEPSYKDLVSPSEKAPAK